METKINIEIKLKDGKTLKLDYEDGKELFEELQKVYGKQTVKEYAPWIVPIVPMEPFKPYYDWTFTDGSTKITCNAENSSIS